MTGVKQESYECKFFSLGLTQLGIKPKSVVSVEGCERSIRRTIDNEFTNIFQTETKAFETNMEFFCFNYQVKTHSFDF